MGQAAPHCSYWLQGMIMIMSFQGNDNASRCSFQGNDPGSSWLPWLGLARLASPGCPGFPFWITRNHLFPFKEKKWDKDPGESGAPREPWVRPSWLPMSSLAPFFV